MGGIAYGGGVYLVVYENEINANGDSVIHGHMVTPSGTVGGELAISSGLGHQGLDNVAYDGTNFLVVWTDDANDFEVKGRFVSPAGALGAEISINASTDKSDNPVTVAFDGTNYLVAWTDEVGGAGSGEWDLFGQLVTPSGALSGSVITISGAPGQQFLPNITFDGTNYLVTWTDMRNDTNKDAVCDQDEGTCFDLFGQYLSKSGTLVGSEFAINTGAGNQFGGPPVFAVGKYLALINNFDSYDGVVGDVYGAFITPPDTSATGTVTGTVTYTGALGAVGASRPIRVVLDPFPNDFSNFSTNGTFEQLTVLATSPGDFVFTNVPPGQYHLVVALDLDNDGFTDPNPGVAGDGDPVEIYTPGNEAGSNSHTDASTAFAVIAGQTYSLSPNLTFGDGMRVGD